MLDIRVVKVVWWKHSCPIGDLSSAKIHRSLNVQLTADGQVGAVSVSDSLPAGIVTQVLNGE